MVSACSTETADWYADQRFTDAERTEVVRGATWLYAQIGRPAPTILFTLDVDEQSLPHTIRRERHPLGERGATGFCAPGPTAYLDPIGLPDEGMKLEYLAGLTAHEMGHCVAGLADDFESDGIMHNLDPMAWTSREEAQCDASAMCRGR